MAFTSGGAKLPITKLGILWIYQLNINVLEEAIVSFYIGLAVSRKLLVFHIVVDANY